MTGRILSLLIGCLFGNFQSSYIFVKAAKGIDIRTVGSHNAGTMNTTVSQGVGLGAVTFLADVLKTVLASLVCLWLFGNEGRELILSYTCLGVALGHEFPFWLGFRGGKGVAVALAFLIMFDYRLLILSVVLSLAVMLILRRLWLGSAAIAVMMSVGAFCLYPAEIGIVVSLQGTLIILLHIVALPGVKISQKKIKKFKKGVDK
ncbi:MAG: glycerol-3-phosphate acyltransferase [Acutalibacteraceae bacterium]